jgi:hypothetical protein
MHRVPGGYGCRSRYFTSDTSGYNVIAELPGTDPALKDEVVMMGGHLDSWASATGATDNADGAATVLEAMRILKTVGAKPRRTIRVALWGGEEVGLFGSRAWVAPLRGRRQQSGARQVRHLLQHRSGYGRVYGFTPGQRRGSDLRPLAQPLVAGGNETSARHRQHNHLRAIAVGVPRIQSVQEFSACDVRIHHTNMDTMERMTPSRAGRDSVRHVRVQRRRA